MVITVLQIRYATCIRTVHSGEVPIGRQQAENVLVSDVLIESLPLPSLMCYIKRIQIIKTGMEIVQFID